ncbi:MAG: DUF2807 domain-containing protein [Bacteroidia bacterium]|nr:DUF2807 domain-containing protein [Bacteroidia bacterium]
MKKIYCFITILFLSLISASAENIIIEKNYNLKDFRGLAVSNTFDVSVGKSDSYSVKVAVSDEYAPYLDIRVSGGVLNIGFKNLPRKLSSTSLIKAAAVAKVTMPSLESISLSGASKFNCEDPFDIGNSNFQASVSGASEIKRVEVYGADASINVSGASKANIAGNFVDVEVVASGTARVVLTADGEELEVKSSGSAVADIEGMYEDFDFKASGAANITMKGGADEMDVECSGAASVDALNAPVRSAEVSLSGASVCKTAVAEYLEAECSGASSLIYKADDDINLKIKELPRTASLRKL